MPDYYELPDWYKASPWLKIHQQIPQWWEAFQRNRFNTNTREMDHYQIEYIPCPKCDHHLIHSNDCINIACEDGSVDISDDDFLSPGSNYETCSECNGTGILRWCPSCGYDISANPDNLAIDFSDEH